MLPAITAHRHDLDDRYARLRAGLILDEVRAVLGGPEFKAERRGAITARFWRFRLADADLPSNEYEIYLADFRDDRFVSGAVLPQG